MLRSGRLAALDQDAVLLVADGLVRHGVAAWLDGDGAENAGAWRQRAGAFAESWLVFGDAPVPGLRVPALPVLRSLVRQAAEALWRVHGEDGPAALEWLGLRSAEVRERACRDGEAHPAEPVALAVVWHAVQALAPEADADHDQRIEDRCEAYVSEHYPRRDTVALALACARLAADALVELACGDPHRAAAELDARAARHMPLTAPAPSWVPDRPR
ncbi:hypothetical protein ACFYNO_37440 [Kitasatospora sp. NPDC006697]|uniref:hypothetical protein n=1 Tax=Kitasatospora sp. NPDC006697 TaxID=3364020 RepID=UPI00367EFDF5